MKLNAMPSLHGAISKTTFEFSVQESTTIEAKTRLRHLFVIVGIMLQRNWLQPAYKTCNNLVIFAEYLVSKLLLSFSCEFDRLVGDALSCFETGKS